MAKRNLVLLVDDDPQLIKLVRTNLKIAGYDVLTAGDAHLTLEILNTEAPDLILLDVMLPEVDGYELCKRIREFAATPIIMLTAKVEDADKVKGLKLGADDYITKPFNVQELLARMEAVLRRTQSSPEVNSPRSFTFGDVYVDMVQRRVFVRGQEVTLTLTEYKILVQLVTNAGRVLLHGELLTRVWGPEYRDEVGYLRAYIRHLRQKLEEDPHDPKYVLSKPGIGYMFASPAGLTKPE